MKKINSNIFKAKKLIIFLFYLQLCYFGIKSNECEKCIYNEDQNKCVQKESFPEADCTACKPSLINKERCFDCSGIQSDNYIISNDECKAASQGCDYKIVNETKECVGHCSSETYEIGDYCVYNCDGSNNKKVTNEDLKICECTGKYIVYQQKKKKKKKRIDRLNELETMQEDGTFDVLPKKEVILLKKEMEKLEKNLGGIKEMKEIPGVMFVVDPKKERIAILEARKLGIPVVGLIDTNCNPEDVDYAIPGNDDAIRAVKLITDVMASAIIEGRQGESYDTGVAEEQMVEEATSSEQPSMEEVVENAEESAE